MYSLVIGVLAAVTIGILVLAINLSNRTQAVYTRETAEYQAAVAERIRPVAQVRLPGDAQGDEPTAGATPAQPEASAQPEPVAAAMSGADVYNSSCALCHGAGLAGAPVFGDQAQWSPRIAQGIETLKKHAIEGFAGSAGVMPPKGGFVNLSDDEVAGAVEYMVGEAS